MVIGSLIAGVPNPLDPMRMLRMLAVISLTAFALISMMFLLMVRVTDPLMPRAMFGVLNTLLYFPSGAVYPQQGFPGRVDAGHRRGRSLYLCGARLQKSITQEHRLSCYWFDLLYLTAFSVVAMTAATILFKRTL